MKPIQLRKVTAGEMPYANDWNDICECLMGARGFGGARVRATTTGLQVYGGGGGLSWCGVVWQKGNRYYDPDISTDTTGYGIGGLSTTKLCLKWYVDDSHGPEYTDGPIPNPLPANMEMEYVANLSSAIHVH